MNSAPIWYEAFKPVLEIDDLPVELKRSIELSSGEVVNHAPGCFLCFDYWNGAPMKHNLRKGNSAMIDLYGEHLFGEIAILRLLERDGWNGRWINPFGNGHKAMFLTSWDSELTGKEQTHIPIEEHEPKELLNEIYMCNGNNYHGCWDIFAWKGNDFLFAESKAQRSARARSPRYEDLPNENQSKWLRAALDISDDRLKQSSFVFAQWDYHE